MHSQTSDKGTAPQGEAAHAPSALVDFFETFVSLDVECARERSVQTRAIAGLVTVGLVGTAGAPLAVVAGLGLTGALVPTLLAALLLACAGALSATGRLDAVAGTLALVLALCGVAGLGWGGAGGALAALGLLPALGIGLFIAARWRARRTGARVEARFERPLEDERAAQILAGPVLRFDAAGRLAAVPEALVALFGPAEGEGRPLVERIHVHDRVLFLDAFADLRRGRGFAEIELRLNANGGERHVALRLAAVGGTGTGDGGELTSVLGCVRDLTEEREATRRLTATLSEAKDASDAKSRFLAAISHELRTPLNAIIGFTDILEQEFFGGFENARQKEYVGLISRSGEHLLHVVNGLLDLSKIEAGRYELVPQTFPAREALEAAAAMVRAEAEKKGLVLIVQEPAEAMMLRADPRAFHQILLNLLSNAVKFTAEGCVHVSARVEGGLQIVAVEDSGAGIGPGDLARIAQPFVRLAGAADLPGSGLGLSLVKGLCELHHGTLRVESRIGVGTTAVAVIPVDCPERLGDEDNFNHKVVSLENARKKAVHTHQTPTGRRTA